MIKFSQPQQEASDPGGCSLRGVRGSLPCTAAPLTRDFIRIGMVPHAMDTARTRRELLARLVYPTIEEGIATL